MNDWYHNWMRIRMFMRIWGLIILVLCVAGIVKYWPYIKAVAAATIMSVINGLMPCIIIIAAIIYILRSAFR